jgi:cytochrome c553
MKGISRLNSSLQPSIACSNDRSAKDGHSLGRAITALVVLLGIHSAPAAEPESKAYPAWAFPGPLNKSVPGSKASYSDVQMFDRTASVDWFPQTHPAMPAAVKGRLPLYACGFCHLPEGAGRPENAALAGLPYEYLKRQIADMQAGLRKAPDPKFGPAGNMILTITNSQLSSTDTEEAAKYYASLTYSKHTKIVETTDIPPIHTDSFVYVFDRTGLRQPLGERIVEGPEDFERFEMRDANVGFTAYVPVGAVARGKGLAAGDGTARASCESCHGPGLKGSAVAPPIAGRPLTPTFRQLYAFKTGTRSGSGAVLMKPIVAPLSTAQMIDLAAFVGSLDP